MNKKNIISCLMALLFTTSINNNYVTNSEIKVYDNLYELGSTRTPKRLDAVDEEENVVTNNLVSDVKVQVTTLEDNQTRDIRFVAAIDSVNYEEVGFEITCGEQTITQKVTKAYSGLEVTKDNIQTAANLFGTSYTYLIAFEIQDVPASTYEYQYSAVAYVKSSETTTKSTTPKKVTVSEMAFDDMKAAATTTFKLTKAYCYDSTHISFGWSEGDTTIPAANIDFTKDVYYRLTLTDGTIKYYDYGQSWSIQDGATTNVFGINCEFKGINTYDGFQKIEMIINNNGEFNYGYVEFHQLPELTNVKVNDYVLTFDTLENAASYTVKIYNDTYTGEETAINSGDKLSVTTLGEGTYNIDITAVGNFGYSNSVTTLENAFTIENSQEILTAPVGAYIFDFDRIGRGRAWETPVKITWSDDKYAATNDNSISEFGFYVGETKKSSLSSIAGFENKYYSDSQYYGIYFSSGEMWDTVATIVYSLRFYITTNNGQTYSVIHHFYVEDIENSLGTDGFNNKNFIQEGTDEYNALINEKNEDALKYYKDEDLVKENAISNSNMTASSIYSEGSTGVDNAINKVSHAIDGDTSTRWESATEDDITLLIDLGAIYKLNKVSIMWEGAYAKDFDILVSTDGSTYSTYVSITDASNYANSWASSSKAEGNEMEARYVKIHCIERATTYGNSIYEVLFFGTEVTA